MNFYYYALIEFESPQRYRRIITLLVNYVAKHSRREVQASYTETDEKTKQFSALISTTRKTPNQITLSDPMLVRLAKLARHIPVKGTFTILKSDENYENETKLHEGEILSTMRNLEKIMKDVFEAELKLNPLLHDEPPSKG